MELLSRTQSDIVKIACAVIAIVCAFAASVSLACAVDHDLVIKARAASRVAQAAA